MNEFQIKTLLHRAPKPSAPAGLRQELLAEIQLPRARDDVMPVVNLTLHWRRWVPALSFGLLFLGCLMVLGVQTLHVFDLRRQNETLQAATVKLEELRLENAELQQLRSSRPGAERLRADAEELLKLRAEAAELRAQAEASSALLDENYRLRTEREAAIAATVVSPENDPFAKAKEKALAVQCISNLKQIGLAARMWARDHKATTLPTDWITMQKCLNTPRILTCPADDSRTRATSWEQFDGTSVSYEFPSAKPDENDPHVVYTRCRIHGQIGYTDGSAHMGVKSDRLEKVDGNLRNRGTSPIAK